jgi:hypothetical protein
MDPQDKASQGPPLSIRFVPGRAKDGATRSLVRSHAMTAFRSRQRRQKQLDNERNQRAPIMNMASIRNSADQFCQCMSVSMPSIATSSQSSERELPSNSLADGRKRCAQCGRVQLLRMSSSQRLGALQQQYPAIATFAAAEFDPFGSMTELPQHLTSNYSQEINAIKTHGSYNLYLAALNPFTSPIVRTVGCHDKLMSESSTLARVIACLLPLSQRKDMY